MLEIPGYTVDGVVHASSHSVVCRGRDDQSQRNVILKFTRAVPPRPTDIARFNRECSILERLHDELTDTAFNRIEHGNRLVLVTEDIGGVSLTALLETRTFDLRRFLHIARRIVDALERLHEKHIVHKDINPSNIVFNPDTEQLAIIDFNLASSLRSETATVSNPNLLEGTPAYMAPEQTGRMNRAIDYRADFYSLGVTLYQLFTGRLPFLMPGIAELVHAHLAIDPVPPHELDERIPVAVSAIVMKLLTKEPEGRYQSLHGLRYDLERCLQELESTGSIPTFGIASQDISDRFQISGRLFGRDGAIDELTGIFEGVAAGQIAFTLVSGYSGIGKSALVHELYKPITRTHGWFVSGKYDQYRRNVPYSGVVAAFRELVSELLTEPEDALAVWREKLNHIGQRTTCFYWTLKRNCQSDVTLRVRKSCESQASRVRC